MTVDGHNIKSTGNSKYYLLAFLGLAALIAIVIVCPGQAWAAQCSDVGSNYTAGTCSSAGRCGDTTYCYCHITGGLIETLCCMDRNTSVDHCFLKNSSTNTWGFLDNSENSVPADATFVDPNISGALTPKKETTPVFFTPNFTLPGSPFIAGQPVKVEGNTLGTWLTFAYVFFVSVAGILAVTMMIYGGIKYTVSFGNPSKLQDARDTIASAMIGLAIALGSYVILLTISPRLVTFQGLQELGTGISPPSEWEESIVSSQKYGVSYKPVSQNVTAYDAMLLAAAGGDKDFAAWLKAIMLVESSGNPMAMSKDEYGNVLACGLMQMLPSTAGVSCDELKNSAQLSIELGTKYFKELLAKTCPPTARYKSGAVARCIATEPNGLPKKTKCENGMYHYAVAAYNGGPGANCGSVDCPGSTWWECEVNTGYAETRNYVAKVEDAYHKIHGGAFGQGADPAFAWSQ
ncbi:MAG: lytic transglycosylase domain-containing protein [Patescibacteria group bacterium]